MRAIGYVRVSTDEQATEDISLEAQHARVTAYCVAKDWDLVGIETDRGFSAKDTNHPGTQAGLNAVRTRQVEAIIIDKLDRLARSVVDLNNIIILLDKKWVAQ
jgi:site-specific DNA recombinase